MKSLASEPIIFHNPMICMGFHKGHDKNLSFMQGLFVQ